MKKLIAALLVMVVIFAGCTPAAAPTTPEDASAPTGENGTVSDVADEGTTQPEADPQAQAGNGEKYKIGVIQLVKHAALDDSYEGFIAGLKEEGFEEGVNITVDLQNAQGEISNTNTIASKLVNDNSDLIMAIATPAAQAVANATDEIPIVITAVTDPADAGLVESNEVPGGNVTGTSDLTPVKEQIDLLMKFVPQAKSIGVLYCSNEANSHLQAAIAKEAIEALGLTYKEFTVSESNQIQQVLQSAVGQIDALYTPTDNMIASAMVQISGIAIENKIPQVGGEEGQVDGGALATYGVNYFNLGKLAGKQAAAILNGADPGTIPIGYQTEYALSINEDTLSALGIDRPEGLV